MRNQDLNGAHEPFDRAKLSRLLESLATEQLKVDKQGNFQYSETPDRNPATTASLAQKFSLGRCFCVTENGYMGLVPPQSELGDIIVIFLSAQVPHVLRRNKKGKLNDPEPDLTYCLVGESYVHGVMDGELMPETREDEQFILI